MKKDFELCPEPGQEPGDMRELRVKEWKEPTYNTRYASVLMRSLWFLCCWVPVRKWEMGKNVGTGVQRAVHATMWQVGHFLCPVLCSKTSEAQTGHSLDCILYTLSGKLYSLRWLRFLFSSFNP